MPLIVAVAVGATLLLGSALRAADGQWTPAFEFNPAPNEQGWITTDHVQVKVAASINPDAVLGSSWLLAESPFYEADLISDSAGTQWTFPGLDDGTHYLTVQLLTRPRQWLKSAPYRLKVDVTPPPPPVELRAYDSLFSSKPLRADEPQSGTARPFFTWSAPVMEPGSPLSYYQIEWRATDAKEPLELRRDRAAAFFPGQALSQSGRYQLQVWTVDEAGWRSSMPATFYCRYERR